MPYKNNTRAKEYKKQWNREYYLNNTDKEKERTKKRKQTLRRWFNEYKETLSCSKCGEGHPACLEFHHTKASEKDFMVSDSIERKGFSRDKILAEINKCTILCANCHRKIHAEGDI
jgi:hypothetical protein